MTRSDSALSTFNSALITQHSPADSLAPSYVDHSVTPVTSAERFGTHLGCRFPGNDLCPRAARPSDTHRRGSSADARRGRRCARAGLERLLRILRTDAQRIDVAHR